MPKLTAGNKVKCIYGGYAYVEQDEVLTVDSVASRGWLRFAGLSAEYNPERFELVDKPNGVDGSGNEVVFTKDDLKPFQRVVLADGRKAVIVNDTVNGGLAMVYGVSDGWDNIIGFSATYRHSISEVYDAPHTYDALNVILRGKLLFKAVDLAKARAEKLEEADKAVAAAQAALEAAIQARSAI